MYDDLFSNDNDLFTQNQILVKQNNNKEDHGVNQQVGIPAMEVCLNDRFPKLTAF